MNFLLLPCANKYMMMIMSHATYNLSLPLATNGTLFCFRLIISKLPWTGISRRWPGVEAAGYGRWLLKMSNESLLTVVLLSAFHCETVRAKEFLRCNVLACVIYFAHYFLRYIASVCYIFLILMLLLKARSDRARQRASTRPTCNCK